MWYIILIKQIIMSYIRNFHNFIFSMQDDVSYYLQIL